jgi:hypothetical protein
MSVTAKMKVNKATSWIQGAGEHQETVTEIEMVPDYAEGRNKDWAKYTPSAVFRMTCTNPEATKQLTLGTTCTVTFEPD